MKCQYYIISGSEQKARALGSGLNFSPRDSESCQLKAGENPAYNPGPTSLNTFINVTIGRYQPSRNKLLVLVLARNKEFGCVATTFDRQSHGYRMCSINSYWAFHLFPTSPLRPNNMYDHDHRKSLASRIFCREVLS